MADLNFKRTYWPTESWRTSTPEEQGMDSELLANACTLVREQELHVHSMLIIRHGHLVVFEFGLIGLAESRSWLEKQLHLASKRMISRAK
jgi:hypothetical protein